MGDAIEKTLPPIDGYMHVNCMVNEYLTRDSSDGRPLVEGNSLLDTVEATVNNTADSNEPAEQDLTEEDDDYRDTIVQRYMPGVFVDVKLKDVYKEEQGGSVRIPLVVDFFEECLKAYKEERYFTYEDTYLRTSHGNSHISNLQNGFTSQGLANNGHHNAPKPNMTTKGGTKLSLISMQANNERKGQYDLGTQDESLDDVMWLKNRPNDPLLNCIQSITDRLNIQGIVGHPATYLAEGGDDMHYDIDDPFIDDEGMYSELQMSRDDILEKGKIEKDFSIWSEEDEDGSMIAIDAEQFIAEYASACNFEEHVDLDEPIPVPLFFHPGGWQRFSERIPKKFHQIFKEFEVIFKGYAGYISTSDIKDTVNTIMESILSRLLKIQEPKQKKPTQTGANDADGDKFKGQMELLERHGLDCVGVGKIIGINGKIMRWIVRTMREVTNAISCYELNKTWIKLVLRHNEETITQMGESMMFKVRPKLAAMKEKKSLKFFKKLDDDLKFLGKRIAQIRKVVRQYEELCEAEDGSPGNSNEHSDVTGKRKISQCHSKGPISEAELQINSTQDHAPEKDVTDCGTHEISRDREQQNTLLLLHDSGELKVEDLAIVLSEDEANGNLSEAEKQSITRNLGDRSLLEGVPADDVDETTSFASLLRQSKLWRRIKDSINIYKLISADILTFVQMINIDLAASIAVRGTDFKELVKDAISLPYVFDKAYIKLADMFSSLIEELCEIKVTIPADVSRVAVMVIHESSSVFDIFECEYEKPLVFYDNSQWSAPTGKVKVLGGKKAKISTDHGSYNAGTSENVILQQLKLKLTTQVQTAKKQQSNSQDAKKKGVSKAPINHAKAVSAYPVPAAERQAVVNASKRSSKRELDASNERKLKN